MYFKTEWSSSRPRKSTNPDVLHRQTQPQSKTASRSPRQPQSQPAVGSITNPTHRHPVLGDRRRNPHPTQPPSSATNPQVAEDGSYRPRNRIPNLHHRRQNHGIAENGNQQADLTPLNLHYRRTPKLSPKMEDTDPQNRSRTSVIGDPTNHSPMTEVKDPGKGFLVSLFGDTLTTRRRRRSDGPKPTYPPYVSSTIGDPSTTRRYWRLQTSEKDSITAAKRHPSRNRDIAVQPSASAPISGWQSVEASPRMPSACRFP